MGSATAGKVKKKLVKRKSSNKDKAGSRATIKIEGMSKALRLKPLTSQQQKKKTKNQARKAKMKKEKKTSRDATNERTIVVRNLSFEITEDVLRKDFEAAGTIESLVLPKGEGGKPKGCALIKFTTQAACDTATSKNGVTYHGRELAVHIKGTPAPKPETKKQAHSTTHKVIARGLPFETQDAELRAHFEKCGEIVSLDMPKNAGGMCRGIAFIQFGNKEAAAKARAQLDGKKLADRKLTVREFTLERAVRAKTAAPAAKKKPGKLGVTAKKVKGKVKAKSA